MNLSIIVAKSTNHVIGNKNQLIWHLPADLKHFKEITSGGAVIMGRKTFESIGRALPNRNNIVITRTKNLKMDGVSVVNSLEDALKVAEKDEKVFIIGGGDIYAQALNLADTLHITEIHQEFDGDTFFPEIDKNLWIEVARTDCQPDEKNPIPYSFVTYKRARKI